MDMEKAEQERLDKLEEEYEKQMKRRRQQGVKRDLDECLREKLKRKAKEVQEGLLQDLFFLKQIMEGEEEEIKNEKKKALLKEQQDYLQHIRDQMRREDEFQREVDQLYQEELEKLWERRRREWEEERNKRRQMEADVMDGVKEQIMVNAEKGRKNELLTLEYGRKVLEEDEEDRRRDKERLRMIRERNNQHQRELREQIRQKEDRMADEKRFLDSELDRLRTAREEEEVKIKNLLQEVEIDNQHPYRVIRREKFDDCRPLQN
ncbi:TPH domain-containing protein [Caerostris darwini]|uniref:TPH domain-containing protein n=1 Tax=Caerostris darwini TaxID=1538125 RepID=A0AAV4M2D3_9ARAC|nr:TPH domain-containing protein [Caerostris darwini]